MSELLSFIFGQGQQFRRVRLPSLYADFSLQRQANPDGFAANTSAWRDALGKAAKAGLIPAPDNVHDTLSLRTGEKLLQSLETKEWGRPLALGAVIDEAVSQRQMIPFQDFFAAPKSIHSRIWIVQPWWLLSWGLKQIGLIDASPQAGALPTGRYVILPNVEEAGEKMMKQMANSSNPVDRIYPISLFSIEAARAINLKNELTDSDLEVILTYLARDKSAILYDSQAVKFKGPGETSSTLSEQDRTIASLKSLIADINMQVILLSARISSLSEDARNAIKNKNRMSAVGALRSRKLNETTLAQRSETLAQLEEVYSKIEQATDQVAIVRVMEASTAVLRNLHSQVGGIDRVENIIDGLREEMDKVDEISNTLEASEQQDGVIDDSAIDDELEDMVQQAKVQEEEKEAWKTQQRLANIESAEESKIGQETRNNEVSETQPSTSKTFAKNQDTPIEEGIRLLGRLSLDENRNTIAQHDVVH
ncbi:hypothetical protein MMC28_004684 [Mycoblastus sanguinarius]|nr:hypothetical protein [Mycoblastus sanguinarius]